MVYGMLLDRRRYARGFEMLTPPRTASLFSKYPSDKRRLVLVTTLGVWAARIVLPLVGYSK